MELTFPGFPAPPPIVLATQSGTFRAAISGCGTGWEGTQTFEGGEGMFASRFKGPVHRFSVQKRKSRKKSVW